MTSLPAMSHPFFPCTSCQYDTSADARPRPKCPETREIRRLDQSPLPSRKILTVRGLKEMR
jgi:hypothetical protein